MTIDWLAIAIACIAALPGLLSLIQQRSKDKVDATSTLTDTAIALVNEVRGENKRLRDKNVSLRGERDELRIGCAALIEQVIKAGCIPIYQLREYNTAPLNKLDSRPSSGKRSKSEPEMYQNDGNDEN